MSKNNLPAYLTAIFIALAGLGFLIATISYFVYLPVPTPLQPLQYRIITNLAIEKTPLFVSVEEKTTIFQEPDLGSEQMTIISSEVYYRVIDQTEGWYKIKVDEEQGWIQKELIKE